MDQESFDRLTEALQRRLWAVDERKQVAEAKAKRQST